MHMSEYRRIDTDKIDATILDRVSEADVQMWLAAKIMAIRGGVAPLLGHMEFDVWFRSYWGGKEQYLDCSINLSGAGGSAHTHKSIESALRDYLLQAADNPDEKAKKHRQKAESHIDQAKRLEELAAKVTSVAS